MNYGHQRILCATMSLYLDIYKHIASTSIHAYRSMLAVPEFARAGLRDYYVRMFTVIETHQDGIIYTLNGEFHREEGPAYICEGFIWWNCCCRRRMENPDGPRAHLEWRQHGLLHRDGDLPAVVCDDFQEWYQHDRRHRDGDLPAVIDAGNELWYQHGQLHRLDGPAAIYVNKYTAWYQHGKLHRDDEPAVVYANNSCQWYCRGKLQASAGSVPR